MTKKGVFVLERRPLCRLLIQVLESRRLNLARNFVWSMRIWLGDRIQLLEAFPGFLSFSLSFILYDQSAATFHASADSMNNRPAGSAQHFVLRSLGIRANASFSHRVLADAIVTRGQMIWLQSFHARI